MIGKRGKFLGSSKKQLALERSWRRVADCSRGGFQPPELHDRRQWTAVYVGSLAVRMTTTETVAVGIGNALNVVGKIPWRQTMQASLNERSQLEIDAFHRR